MRMRLRHAAAGAVGAAMLLGTLGAQGGCSSSGGSSGGGSKVSVTVANWAPEGANHVAVQVTYTNNGTSGASPLCTFDAIDDGGSVVGDVTDGPADDVAPGASVNLRLLIKTDVESDLVSDVRQDTSIGCS